MSDIAGCLLAGGKNLRMGGEKKLFLEYEGIPFYRHILAGMADLETIYLSVDEPEPYIKTGLPLIEDKYPGTGPLGAVCTGLECCPQEALLIAACDMPFLDRETVKRLKGEYQRTLGIVITEMEGKISPFPGVYPKSALPVLLRQLQNGKHKMTEAIKEAGYGKLMVERQDRNTININTPQEYYGLKKQNKRPFVFAVSGYKNSGKTTLITKLIQELKKRGHKVAVIKHDGHDFEGDVPGTDTYRFQKAGAYGTAVYSLNRLMVIKECGNPDEKMLMEAFKEADIILIEGLKDSDYPKYVCNYPQKLPISAAELADRIENTVFLQMHGS